VAAGSYQFLSVVGRHWSWGISWNWSRSISWSRSRSIGWNWSRSISWWWCVVSILVVFDETLVRAGNPLVFNISVVLFVLIHEVVHDLDSAVGKLHTVLAFHIVSVSLLSPGVNVGVSVLVIAVHVVAELIVLRLLLVVGLWVVGGLGGVRGRMDSVVDSVVRDNRGGVDSVMGDNGDWVGNNWCSMDSMVGDYRGGMNSMMDTMVGNKRSWMNSMVSHGMWSQGNSWAQVRGVMSGGDDNTSVADGGVVGDITTDPGHQGPQCYCCYLHPGLSYS